MTAARILGRTRLLGFWMRLPRNISHEKPSFSAAFFMTCTPSEFQAKPCFEAWSVFAWRVPESRRDRSLSIAQSAK